MIARSLRAQLAYLQGDAETALRWADAYTAPAPDRLLTWLQDPHLAKAQHPPGKRHGRGCAGGARHPGCAE